MNAHIHTMVLIALSVLVASGCRSDGSAGAPDITVTPGATSFSDAGGAPGEGLYSFANAGREGNDGIDGDPPTSTDQEPVAWIGRRDVMVWCNALTEYYYDGAYASPIRDSVDDDSHATELGADYSYVTNPNAGGFDDPYVDAGADGFRLPSIDEWEMVVRWIGITAPSTGGDLDSAVVAQNQNGGSSPLTPGYYWAPGDYTSGATADYSDATATGEVAWTFDNSGGPYEGTGHIGFRLVRNRWRLVAGG